MFEHLPAELVLHVATFLSATDILRLGSVSRGLKKTLSDRELWRRLCFRDSNAQTQSAGRSSTNGGPTLTFQLQPPVRVDTQGQQGAEQARPRGAWSLEVRQYNDALRRWDSTIPNEDLDWHSDYIGRHAQLQLHWLSSPTLEARGLGLVDGSRLVAPVDDGSLRVWDVNADSDSYGRLIDQSYPGVLFSGADSNRGRPMVVNMHGHAVRDSMSTEAINEGVTIDSDRMKAYMAFGSSLSEVDLNTFQVSAQDHYAEDISVLSPMDGASPLTVGTSKALYIYDPRTRPKTQAAVAAIKAHMRDDSMVDGSTAGGSDCAPLSQPLPLSIVQRDSHYIHVAGRFPSILNYDRRSFPRVQSTVYSGARLSCLTTMPCSAGCTDLVAAGDYNGKGSIEIYPIENASASLRREQTRNRASASRSKCLSLVSHGSRLLFSDSDGMLKWVERDGRTLVRRRNINEYGLIGEDRQRANEGPGIFNAESGVGHVARRMLPVNSSPESDVAIWTGEMIGLMSFGKKREISGAPRENDSLSGSVSDEERDYGRMMRRALERQADEVRFVQNMGFGQLF